MPQKLTVPTDDELDKSCFWSIIWRFSLLLLAALFIGLCCGLYSCKGPQWAMRKQDQVARLQPAAVNAWHAQHYQPRIIDSTHTEYIPGDIMVVHDTTLLYDTLNNTYYRDVHHYQHDTIRIVHVLQVENTAHIAALGDSLKATGKRIDKLQSKALEEADGKAKWKSMAIWTWVILGIAVLIFAGTKAWKLYKSARTINIAKS